MSWKISLRNYDNLNNKIVEQMKSDKNKSIEFKNEAIYRIVVTGILSESYSSRMPEMQIKVSRDDKNKPFTTLIGEIKDQAALSGIINDLYDSQHTMISVNMLSDIEK
jgi:hypothetical protein